MAVQPFLLLAGLSAARLDAANRDAWRIVAVADGAAAIAAATLDRFSLILIDAALPDLPADQVAVRIAGLPGARGHAVIRIVTPDTLPNLAEQRALAVMPAEDVAPLDPLARLSALLGPAIAADLLRRFHGRLALLLAAPDPLAIGEGATLTDLAHRLAGLAGTLDFPLLSASWAAVERDGTSATDEAWTETRIARAMLDRLLGPIP